MTQVRNNLPVNIAPDLVRQRVLSLLGNNPEGIKTREIADAIPGAEHTQVRRELERLLGEGKVKKTMKSRRAGARWQLRLNTLSIQERADATLPAPEVPKTSHKFNIPDALANRIPLRVEILRNMVENRGVGTEYCDTDFLAIRDRFNDFTQEVAAVLTAFPASNIPDAKPLVKTLFAPIVGVQPPLAQVVFRIQTLGRDAIMRWGAPAQKMMIMEEIAELQHELGRFQKTLSQYQKRLCKVERAEKPDTREIKDAIIDELADNLIMIFQATQIFQLDTGRVFGTVDQKLDRLENKLRESV